MAGLGPELLEQVQLQFSEKSTNLLALNTCVKYGPEEILHSRKQRELTSHVFNHKVSIFLTSKHFKTTFIVMLIKK